MKPPGNTQSSSLKIRGTYKRCGSACLAPVVVVPQIRAVAQRVPLELVMAPVRKVVQAQLDSSGHETEQTQQRRQEAKGAGGRKARSRFAWCLDVAQRCGH